jgi:hypothetical protein
MNCYANVNLIIKLHLLEYSKKNKKYRIKDIIYRTNYDYDGSHDLLTKLKYFMINDNYYSEYFVNTHFYSEQEIRKLKLEK